MQTSYAEQPAGIPGMIGDNSDGKVVDTVLNGEASAEIGFGKFVVIGTGGTTSGTPPLAKLPAASGDDYENGGFVVLSHDYDRRLDLGTTGIKPKRQMGIMRRGRIYVHAETAMAKTDDVYVRYTASGDLVVGNIRNDADTAKAKKLYGARVVYPITAAGTVMIEVDMMAYKAKIAS